MRPYPARIATMLPVTHPASRCRSDPIERQLKALPTIGRSGPHADAAGPSTA